MVDFRIVRATHKHISDITVIEKLSFAIPWSPESITQELTQNDAAVYFCAEVNGNAIGYGGMWQVLDEGHITNIAVHPEYRRSGVGNAIMEALLSEARIRGIKALTLEVRDSNFAAQALYKRHGFAPAGKRKSYYADNNEDAIIMWKKLD